MALTMARLYTGNYDVVALRNAYHGMSPATMGLTALSTWKYNMPQVGSALWGYSAAPQRDDPNEIHATSGRTPATPPMLLMHSTVSVVRVIWSHITCMPPAMRSCMLFAYLVHVTCMSFAYHLHVICVSPMYLFHVDIDSRRALASITPSTPTATAACLALIQHRMLLTWQISSARAPLAVWRDSSRRPFR